MKYIETSVSVGNGTAKLHCYIPEAAPNALHKNDRPAVVVLPGGAYFLTFAGEAEPIAFRFVSEGICAFVLDYTVNDKIHPLPYDGLFPQPQLEALATIKYVRNHAEEFGINTHNISLLGFSAGGHLCASVGTLWDNKCFDGLLDDKCPRSDYRPDRLILCYPVITTDRRYTHAGSFENLLNKKYKNFTKEDHALLSAEKRVTKRTPPSFIWSTAEDNCVPPQNSILFAKALTEKKVPYELHVFPHGAHGSCTGDYVTEELPFGSPLECSEWTKLAIRFIFDEKIK